MCVCVLFPATVVKLMMEANSDFILDYKSFCLFNRFDIFFNFIRRDFLFDFIFFYLL